MFKNLRKKKKGFTLIELIIVIAIIAILAAVAVPRFGDVRKNANVSADIANAKQIQGAVLMVIADGKVELPTKLTTFIFDGKADNTDEKIELAIKEQLQDSIPKLKAEDKGKYFKVTVTTDGKTSITTETSGTPIYPNGTGVYVEK